MDQWREVVSVCTPRSVVSALDIFAGQALGLVQTARGVERLPNLGALAVRLTEAVESEATAFETLSDDWTAENGLTGGAGLFQQLAAARSAAELERAGVTQALLARQNNADEASRDLIEVFSSNLATLNLDWDQFHRAYDAFRTEVIDPEDETAESGLAELLIKFGSIVDQVRKLPDTSLTRDIAGRLADAADGEQLLLRRLLSPDAALAENVPVLPEDLAITDTDNGGAGLSDLTLSEATVFDVFDTHVASVNQLRRALRNELDDARASLSESGRENVGILLFQVRRLGLDWDDFHDGYDDWRRDNGGCDQGQALDALGDLAAEFGQTLRDIRALPSGTLVRGVGGLLLEAAEREQAAVASLRETWRSLDTSSFSRYSAERSFAGTLRRQAALELQDLLAIQGIDSGG
jgi:hypothetical protein